MKTTFPHVSFQQLISLKRSFQTFLLLTALTLFGSPAFSQVKILSLTTARTGVTSWTFDGSRMTNTRAKVLNPANFGPGGTVSPGFTITDANGPITEALLSNYDILFIGFIVDGTFSASELAAMNSWVNNGGKMLITADAGNYDDVAASFGYATSNPSGNVGFPAPGQAGHPIFNGPFGTITQYSAAGALGYFSNTTGATVLGQDAANRAVLLEKNVGAGYILITGDICSIDNVFQTPGAGISNNSDRYMANMFAYVAGLSAGCTDPATPTNLTVSKDSAFVANINWDDNSNNEDGFVVYRSSASGGLEILDTTDADVTSFADEYVPYFDENVDYYVVAIDDDCESAPSNTDYFYQPGDLNSLSLRYVCYDSNSDSLTWKIQNSGNYYRPVIWAQWWSTQQDTVWAAPNGDSYFKTKNNPQSGSTYGDDNITGIYYWVSYYVMESHTRTHIRLSNSCSSARFEASRRAGKAHLGAGAPALEIANPTDLGDELLRQNLTVGPNPVSSRIWITPVEAMDQEATYTVMDAMGRTFLVGEGNLLGNMEVDMSELAAGVYMLRIESGGLSTTHRVIKQ